MLIRPRILNISTDFAKDNSGENSVTVNLENSINPMDGFTLAGGIRQIAIDFTATNISESQKNNKMLCKIEYYELSSHMVYNADDDGNSVYIDNPNYDAAHPKKVFEKTIEIILDDGLYQTYDELFNQINEKLKIDTGLRQNINFSDNSFSNIIFLEFLFEKTSSGFQISLLPNTSSIRNDNTVLKFNPSANPVPTRAPSYATEFNFRLKSITLLPHPQSTLWDFLFFNNVREDFSPGVPDYDVGRHGNNPPELIKFEISDAPLNNLNYNSKDAVISPYSDFIYQVFEYGVVDYSKKLYQEINFPYNNRPWKSFSFPYINPLYIDIKSAKLNGIGFTDDGSFSILHRFTCEGVTDGVNSLSITFDNPVMYALSKESFNEIDFLLDTTNNIWRFYNVRITVSFLFHELPDEVDVKVQPNIITIPENDPITSEIASLVPSRYNPVHYYPQNKMMGKSHFFTNNKRKFN